MAKTWQEKFDSTKPPVTKRIDKDFADMKAGTVMFIATPKIIDAYVNQIPFGKTTDLPALRTDLALEHNAEMSCPVTSSIFLRIVSEVAYEKIQAGKSHDEVTPFWRAVDPKSPLAGKLSCGKAFVKEMREEEQ